MRRCNTLFGFIDRLGIFQGVMVFALALMLNLGGGNTGALGAAGAAVSALDIYQAYETGGPEAALQTAGIHAATAVVGGVAVRTGFKVGGVVYSRADAAWKAFTTANPHLAAAAQSAKAIRTAATPAKITPTPVAPTPAPTTTKITKKQLHDQPWTVRPGQEYKSKIVGRAQKTGTPGHDVAAYRAAIPAAKRTDVERVYLDRAYSTTTGVRPQVNRRPDVTIKYKDGRVDVIEIQSKSDKWDKLIERNEIVKYQLPLHMRGKVRAFPPTKIPPQLEIKK